jgi:hypothetical protein
MLLKSYTKEIFNNECMPSAMSVQCFAHLNEDVGEALPYLNASLGGHIFTQGNRDPQVAAQDQLWGMRSSYLYGNCRHDGRWD